MKIHAYSLISNCFCTCNTWWTQASTVHAPLALCQVRYKSLRGEVSTARHTKVTCRTHTLDPSSPEENTQRLVQEQNYMDPCRLKHILYSTGPTCTHKNIHVALKGPLH